MKLTKVMVFCLYVVGICVVLAGIAIEIIMGAHIGFVLITAGAVMALAFPKTPRNCCLSSATKN